MRAVQQVQADESLELVGAAPELNRITIYDWLAKYRSRGWNAVRAKPVPGQTPRLSEEQIKLVWMTVRTKNAMRLK